jgi:hypothetical protein
MRDICEAESAHQTQCFAHGSTSLESDLDVTITGRYFPNVRSLMSILLVLGDVFSDSPCFHINTSDPFDSKKFARFFELHFYLSNFAVFASERDQNSTLLSSYILSTDYIQQYRYAFAELKHSIAQPENVNTSSEYLDLTFRIGQNIDQYYQFKNIQGDDDKLESLGNKIIDLISELSFYEIEGYHTQGAFFHVVLNLQRHIEFDVDDVVTWNHMMITSCIENMCLATAHPNRCEKYIYRTIDAFYKVIGWKHINTIRIIRTNLGFILRDVRSMDEVHAFLGKEGTEVVLTKIQECLMSLHCAIFKSDNIPAEYYDEVISSCSGSIQSCHNSPRTSIASLC